MQEKEHQTPHTDPKNPAQGEERTIGEERAAKLAVAKPATAIAGIAEAGIAEQGESEKAKAGEGRKGEQSLAPRNAEAWSPQQDHMLDLIAATQDTRSFKAKAEAVGVARETAWRWRQLPGWKEEVLRRSKQNLAELVPRANRTLGRVCDNGDTSAAQVSAAKAIHQGVGFYEHEQPQQAGPLVVQIVNAIGEGSMERLRSAHNACQENAAITVDVTEE